VKSESPNWMIVALVSPPPQYARLQVATLCAELADIVEGELSRYHDVLGCGRSGCRVSVLAESSCAERIIARTYPQWNRLR
jgi:hypothetical protein